MKIEKESRLVFMKYALPCARTLVKRGNADQTYIDMLIDIVKNNGEIPKDAEKIFKVAFSACSLAAIDDGKSSIDAGIIRKYFLFGHDKVIGSRYEEMGDFDPEACRVRAGVVESVENEKAVVYGPSGRKAFRIDFVPDARKNDIVVTHWNFIVEKTDKETAERMNNRKLSGLVE